MRETDREGERYWNISVCVCVSRRKVGDEANKSIVTFPVRVCVYVVGRGGGLGYFGYVCEIVLT